MPQEQPRKPPAEVVPGIHLLEARMGGQPEVCACYLVTADEPALIERLAGRFSC